jgi:hypothetical protein
MATKMHIYKGYEYFKDKYGLWSVKLKSGDIFIVALNDSKSSGGRKIVDSANNVKTAKKYIDFISR